MVENLAKYAGIAQTVLGAFGAASPQVASAIGDKLTQVGVYWDTWLHSTFFAMLASLALATAIVLLCILKPLKRAMPGV